MAYQAPHGHPPAKTRRVPAGLDKDKYKYKEKEKMSGLDKVKYKDKEKDKDGRPGLELRKDK